MSRLPAFIVAALVIAGIVVALSNAASDEPGAGGDGPSAASAEERLARAMCGDLSDGFSWFQIHSQAVEHYRGTGRSEDAAQLAAAKLEDLASREYCPQFREGFEATYTYETWIKP
jgi:hypothetical protein